MYDPTLWPPAVPIPPLTVRPRAAIPEPEGDGWATVWPVLGTAPTGGRR